MNDDARAGLDRRAAEWLDDGPDAAPAGVLAATLARSRATRQRPGWVAIALGTPAMTEGGAGVTIPLRPVAIVLALLLAAAAMLAVIGSQNQRPVTVLASPTPAALPSTRPTPSPTSPRPTPGPASPAPTVTLPEAPARLVATGWAISIQRPAELPWQAVEAGFEGNRVGIDVVGDQTRYVLTSIADHAAWDLHFGDCAPNGCAGPLITVSLARSGSGLLVNTTSCSDAPPSFFFDCLASNDVWPVTIAGTTAAELKRAWLAKFSTSTASRRTIDGEPAFVLERGNRLTLLAVHGDTLIAVIYETFFGDSKDEAAAAFDAVVANVRFE